MEKDTIILSRKIQLHLDCNDKEKRLAYYQQLFDWRDLVYRGSNMVMSHHYIQERIKDLIYLRDDVKVKLADFKKDPDGIFTSSKLNTTYRILSLYFKGKLPSKIISSMNMTLNRVFAAERISYWKGEKSLKCYKQDLPIPFPGDQVKLKNDEKGHNFKLVLFKIPFRTYLGKDCSDKKVLLQKALVGQIKICTSAIKIVKGKIFLLLTLELPKEKHKLSEHIIAEASLSMEYPITVCIGKEYHQIGSKEEFLYRRMSIQAARGRFQKACTFNKGGRGRKKKLECLSHFKKMEWRYVDSRLHLYSRRLIDICVKSEAGTLLLLNQSAKEKIAKEDEFLLRNWSYYGLIEKIKYKAERAGIYVIVE
ncbi:hypothetical protein [Sphingobacterium hungaricum]|uniref:Transposase n=1 Tax=Sphingobacterium hungaricum TaxID=2082723 RepID=A0A928V238_9SPHI|nr:hypothetical protein [Sphingobacterium hungaricum]MBE8715224.1 hypothetical protein [Sphingobacterium hungaricum]